MLLFLCLRTLSKQSDNRTSRLRIYGKLTDERQALYIHDLIDIAYVGRQMMLNLMQAGTETS